LIFTPLILLLIICYSYEKLSLELLGSALAGLIAIYISLEKQSMESDMVFKDLFNEFNNRYNSALNDIFNKMRLQSVIIEKPEGNKEGSELDEKEKLMIIDYFNLCAEEYLWYSKGRIPQKIWNAWEKGILENLNLKDVINLFEQETNTTQKSISYYGFAEYIKPFLEKGNSLSVKITE